MTTTTHQPAGEYTDHDPAVSSAAPGADGTTETGTAPQRRPGATADARDIAAAVVADPAAPRSTQAAASGFDQPASTPTTARPGRAMRTLRGVALCALGAIATAIVLASVQAAHPGHHQNPVPGTDSTAGQPATPEQVALTFVQRLQAHDYHAAIAELTPTDQQEFAALDPLTQHAVLDRLGVDNQLGQIGRCTWAYPVLTGVVDVECAGGGMLIRVVQDKVEIDPDHSLRQLTPGTSGGTGDGQPGTTL